MSVSDLQLIWAASDDSEKLNIALTHVISLLEIAEGNKVNLEMNDGTKYTLTLEVRKDDESN